MHPAREAAGGLVRELAVEANLLQQAGHTARALLGGHAGELTIELKVLARSEPEREGGRGGGVYL